MVATLFLLAALVAWLAGVNTRALAVLLVSGVVVPLVILWAESRRWRPRR